MKKFMIKKRKASIVTTSLLLALIFTFSATSNSFAADISNSNKVNAKITESYAVSSVDKKLEKIKIAEVDIRDLTVGENEIYNDGETVIKLNLEIPTLTNPSNIQPMAGGDSGWSGGWIPETATLNPHKSTKLTDLSYTLFWHNNRIDSVHSLDYRIGLGEVTNASTSIIRSTPNGTHASAIGEIDYIVTEFGAVVGSYNHWLRTDIDRNGRVRTVWNY